MKPKAKDNKQKKGQKRPTVYTLKPNTNLWWKDKKTLFMLLLVIAATFIVMSPALKNDFVDWDDNENVFENPAIHSLSSANIVNIFSTPVIGNYNPLTIVSFAVEYHFIKLDPFYYHLDNLLLHLINTFLVFLLMLLLGLKRPWALLVTILFGIHPMRVESVAWVTERKDVLFAMFYLASILTYIYHFKTKKKKYLLLTLIFFILSLLSKIQAVALPLSLLLVDYILKRPLKMKLIIEKIPYFLLSLATGIIGVYFLSKQQSLDPTHNTFIERLLIGSYSACVYVVKSVFPYQLSTIYSVPKSGELPYIYYATPFIIIILAYLVYRTARFTKTVVFGALFFLVNIVFVLQIVGAGQGFIADRFSYIPYFGLFYVFASSISRLLEKQKKLMPFVAVFVFAVLVTYAVYSRNHVGVWKNTDTLFTDVLAHDKNIGVAYLNRGRFYREKKMYDKATADFSRLLELKPEDHNSYIARGRLYFETGKYDKAFVDFNKAIELNPNSTIAYSNRGAIYGMRKQYDPAIKDLDKALMLSPTMKDALLNRALLFYQMQQFIKAIKDCDAYLALVPDNSGSYNLRALCKASLNQTDGALQDYDLALKYKPDDGMIYQNRSLIYFKMGNIAKAREDVSKAQQLGQKVPQIYLDKLK